MNFLDFLNESPKFFIFQKKANKSNFGGVLFLIYILIMILISLAYILDYAFNDIYTYETLTFYNHTDNREEIAKMNENDELNPYFNLTISFWNNGDFALFDIFENKFLESDEVDYLFHSNYYIRKKASEINFFIFYKCGDDIFCSSFEQFIEYYQPFWSGSIQVDYTKYNIDHSADIPVQKVIGDKDWIKEELFLKNETGYDKISFEWEVIKYKDQKSLFDSLTGNRKEYIFGFEKNDKKPTKEFMKFDNYSDYSRSYYELGVYLPLFHITYENNHEEYLFYKRKKVEILDVLANIGALFSTVKFFFSLFFSFYSTNFDNYKIMCKILNPEKEPLREIELSSEINESLTDKNKEKNKFNEIDINNNIDALIDNYSDENKKDEDIKAHISHETSEDSPIILNKLSFIDFYFNNLYSKCCKKIKKQEIINTTNEIIYKYISIDSLLYNQIKLENLFKDYKWNNKSLNNIHNNKMIIKLKNL